MIQHIGYSQLITRYRLRALPLAEEAQLASDVKGRDRRQHGGRCLNLFEPKYQPEDTLAGHLQFVLRYEGVNLQVLALLFAAAGKQELAQWITTHPESRYARSACYLYEWLTRKQLPVADPVSPRTSYVQCPERLWADQASRGGS